MVIKNFQLKEVKGRNSLDWVAYATVDVKKWPWNKFETKDIAREYACHWYFIDTGRYTPGFEVENLARAWEGKNKRKIFK